MTRDDGIDEERTYPLVTRVVGNTIIGAFVLGIIAIALLPVAYLLNTCGVI